MSTIKQHIRELENYHINEEMKLFERVFNKISTSESRIKEQQIKSIKIAEKRVRWGYKDFPKASNPTNKIHQTIFFYLLHVIGSIIPFLNIWIYYKYFNLYFRKVKMNAIERYQTKTIKNHKRDRRFKKGYRDESVRWQTMKVVPKEDNPYWNLVDAEVKHHKKWLIIIGVGYIGINLLTIGDTGDIIMSNIFFMVVGLIVSLVNKGVNKKGVTF